MSAALAYPADRDGRGRARTLILVLALILLVAGALRGLSYNWDQGTHQHPDEYGITLVALERVQGPAGRPLAELADAGVSPLNPRRGGADLPYGALPVYLAKAVSSALAALTGDAAWTGFDGTQLTGRVLAALADTGTVLLVALVGARLWGLLIGALAGGLYAFAILPIQIAHFYISDPFLTSFLTAGLLASVLLWQTGRAAWALGAGLVLGLGLACKITALPMVLLPLAAIGLGAMQRRPLDWRWLGLAAGLVAIGLIAGLGIGDPFALLDAPTYLKQVAEQAAIQSGASDRWWTRRYVGTWPLLYPWSQLALVGVGPLVGLAGSLGLGLLAARGIARRRSAEGLVALGAAVYFLSIGFVEAKWVRYLLPLVPYLCLGAAAAAATARVWGSRRAGQYALVAVPIALMLVSAAVGAVAYQAIYGVEHTYVQMLKWLYTHAPAGSQVGIEANDGPQLLPLPGYPDSGSRYGTLRLRMLADLPGPEAAALLREQLAAADYLLVGNTRAPRIVPRMPWRYPVQGRYYELLFGGQLGFSPVYTATSQPAIFGLEIRDDGPWIDASFYENDHPTWRVFQKRRDLSAAEWTGLFAEAAQQPAVASRYPPGRE